MVNLIHDNRIIAENHLDYLRDLCNRLWLNCLQGFLTLSLYRKMCSSGLGAPQSSLFAPWQCLQVSSSPPGLLIRPAEGLGLWFLPHLRSKLQVFSVLVLLGGAHQLLYVVVMSDTSQCFFRSCSRAGVHHLLSSSSDRLQVWYSHTWALLHRSFMNHLFRETILSQSSSS